MKKLEGKVAVITGGSSGIGLATAKRFVEEGAHVVITGRPEKELKQAAAFIKRNVTTVVSDVSRLEDLDRLYAVVKEKHGHIDILFANAGAGTIAPLAVATEAHFDQTFDVNVKGLFFTVQKAYNYYHNTQAAQLAKLLGEDPAPYAKEAGLIARAMREFLWMPDRGMFAEFKDYLGLQRIHPSAALWSFYHTMDADLVNPSEALRMADYVNTYLPRIPVAGKGVPTDDAYSVLPTTDWMPYSWSINNVVMGENIHTALGLWQAGRAGEAFRLAKSALLASMFMGICPGNVGTLNYLDVYR